MNKHPNNMKKHQFILILSGVAEVTAELADSLYEATKGDIEFAMRDGIAFLEFKRSAPTLRQAILTAIRDVEGANVGVRVVRIESDSANTIAKLNADLVGISTLMKE